MTDALLDPNPRNLGDSKVGPIGFGLWRFTNNDLGSNTSIVETALDAGMNLFDTADIYGMHNGIGYGLVETLFGKVLAATPSLREQIFIATKGGITAPIPWDSSPEYLRAALEGSLRRLRVDHVDLYQIHRPDLFTHPETLAGVLDEMVNSGKVGSLGVSNYTPFQTLALNSFLSNKLVSIQPEFSAAHLQPMHDGNFDVAMQLGLTPLAWSPLAGGRLATGENIGSGLLEVLDRLAEREAATRSDIALAFVLCHPSRPIAIVGTQNPKRIASAPDALSVNLDRNDVYDIMAVSEQKGRD